MPEAKVKIALPEEGRALECSKGENLYAVLSAAGLIDAPCGGRGVCGKCGVLVNGEKRLSCEVTVKGDLSVTLPGSGAASRITSTGFRKEFQLDPQPAGSYGVAIDIGTTTVVASLIDLSTGEEADSFSCLNSQKSCGQDVITRIHYADENEGGLAALQRLILDDLRGLIGRLLEQKGLPGEAIKDVTVAGNTTMIHLFGGVDPHCLSAAPYKPAFEGPFETTAGALGFPLAPNCPVYCLPAVAAYVGGDITAGILACGVDEARDRLLFIDIGTNGEMVLADRGRLFACSCAAGPALEGMNITCGMRAADGAIEDVTIEGESVRWATIGGAPPCGICGSGLLALVSEMRSHGLIDESGRLTAHPLVTNVDGKKRVQLDAEHDVYLNQKDVRQVQLAKGAILSGVVTMLKAASLAPEDLDRVIVAGQFGAHLKAASITGSGLIPEVLQDRITYAGNTSISGAAICLLSKEQRAQCERAVDGIQYIELSTLEGFDKVFVESLKF